MAKFVLDCDAVQSVSDNIKTLETEMRDVLSSIKGYDVTCEDNFDFASAKSAIVTNVNAAVTKLKNAGKLIDTVIETHTTLQNSLVFEPNISNTGAINYVVTSTDTLSDLAEEHGTTVEAIAKENNIKDPDLIYDGEVLSIPTGVSVAGAATAKEVVTNSESISNDKKNVKNINTNQEISYKTGSVDGNSIVAGNSGYTMNQVLTKIKQQCEKEGIGEHWVDICAISLWETGNYTSEAFVNNNIGGLSYADGQTRYFFDSIDAGIEAFVSNLKTNYYDQGLTTIESIAPKYCPPTYNNWTSNVNIMKNQIENCL